MKTSRALKASAIPTEASRRRHGRLHLETIRQIMTSPQSCRRDVGNRGDSGRNRKIRRQERIGSVAADPDNQENIKEAGREAQGTPGLK